MIRWMDNLRQTARMLALDDGTIPTGDGCAGIGIWLVDSTFGILSKSAGTTNAFWLEVYFGETQGIMHVV